ncbi:MAG TPA: ABC transporter substrate-binding protein [Candidatus Dormibacteraeota bacterium]|nr:ABC transporter substrate-binding protein [Candidatus Dormibacteraeota bacterium]
MSPRTSRRAFLAAGLGATAAVLTQPLAARAANASVPVRIQLDFLPFGRYAPYYLALEEGYYAKRGVDVSIAPGSGTGPALQQLIAGRAQVSFVDIPSMMVLMGRGVKPKMRSYAVFYAKAPETVFYFEGGAIKSPKDLEGKTIATSAGSTDFELFPLFAAAQGIDASKITWVTVDPSAKVGLFLQGKVDATTTYVLGLPGVQAKAGARKVGHFTYGEYGVDAYGNGLVVTDDFAAAHPDAVRGVVQATIEGYKGAFKDPARAAAAMKKHVPTLDLEQAAAEVKIVQELAYGAAQKAHGLGYQDAAGMTSSLQAVEKYVLKAAVSSPVADFYSNAYIG